MKQEKRELEARIEKMTYALVPVLRRTDPKESSPIKKTPQHEIKRNKDSFECSCGHKDRCEDPGKLQELIALHYRENVSTLRGGRKTWPQIKNLLEEQSPVEISEEEKTG